MKLLVIGNGGREHALLLKLKQSPRVKEIHCLRGNAGMVAQAVDHDLAADDIEGIVQLAVQEKYDMVVVGPEAPLVQGIADSLQLQGIPVFGPVQGAARLEGSKAFSKEVMWKAGIPTARGKICTSPAEARGYIAQEASPLVVKADGLAAGKGVFICPTAAEAEDAVAQIMERRIFGAAGDTVVIEEMMSGREVSLLFFADGKRALAMVPAQDHKRIFDKDQGPNTGGMGAFAPASTMSDAEIEAVRQDIVLPVMAEMARQGFPYHGVLYVGLMLTSSGPKVLEFNARFGDPETQVILPLLQTDLVEVMEAVIQGKLDQISLQWATGYCLGVVLASEGYPGAVLDGRYVKIDDEDNGGQWLIHAGTRLTEEGVLTKGGRVFAVTALGESIEEARRLAYQRVEKISFAGKQNRSDIGLT